MSLLTTNDVIAVLYYEQVRVRTSASGAKMLTIVGGNKLPPMVNEAIRAHKQELIAYYDDECLLQWELDHLDKLIKNPTGYDLDDLHKRYNEVNRLRKENMIKPWATCAEDNLRCPDCPNLGKPANDDGSICKDTCKKPL